MHTLASRRAVPKKAEFKCGKVVTLEISRHSHRLPATFTHAHANTYEIMYCLCGSYVFHYEKPDHTVVDGFVRKPRTMIFIPKNVPHGLRVLQYPYERYFIQFSDRTTDRVLRDSICQSIFQGDADSSADAPAPRFLDVSSAAEKVEAILEEMYDVQFSLDWEGDWKSVYQSSLLGQLFSGLYRDFRSFFCPVAAPYTQPVQMVKNYMDEHYDQPITIQALAGQCFMSPNYLSKSFHSQIGMSPRQYLTRLRVSMGKKLLCSSQMSIQEIAMRTGFGDVNYFIQHFKACYGKTPKQYRKTMIEEKILD